MVKYISQLQRSAVYAMLIESTFTNEDIAADLGISLQQVRRYRSNYLLTGEPFRKSRAPQNASKLMPWTLDVGSGLLSQRGTLASPSNGVWQGLIL
jgi:hypothetical protein